MRTLALALLLVACSRSPRQRACAHLVDLAMDERARVNEAIAGIDRIAGNPPPPVTPQDLEAELAQCVAEIDDEQAACILAASDSLTAMRCRAR